MYGVTYYALLSALLIDCDRFIPDLDRSTIGKMVRINAGVLVVWIVISYGLFHADIHYGSRQSEPWSLETVGTVKADQIVTQEVHFENLSMGTAYLKNISTILVNLSEDKKDGTLQVEFSENGDVLSTSEVQISDIAVGEWFRIPIECKVSLGHEYQVTYTVYANELSNPCLLIQDETQAISENDMLYIDGISVNGALANKYEIDEFLFSGKAKICIAFIILAAMEYGIFLIDTGTINKLTSRQRHF